MDAIRMEPGVVAAVLRYPGARLAIKELALRSETFRSLCADLAEAESALRRWESGATPESEERCREYRTLVAALDAEVRSTIERYGAGGVRGGGAEHG